MLKQTITENKLITPQTIKQSFDNIKKAALIESSFQILKIPRKHRNLGDITFLFLLL